MHMYASMRLCSHGCHPPDFIWSYTSSKRPYLTLGTSLSFFLSLFSSWSQHRSTMKSALLIGMSVPPARLYAWCSHPLFLFNLVCCILARFPDNQVLPGKDYCTLHFKISWMKETRFLVIVSSCAFCWQYGYLPLPLQSCSITAYRMNYKLRFL